MCGRGARALFFFSESSACFTEDAGRNQNLMHKPNGAAGRRTWCPSTPARTRARRPRHAPSRTCRAHPACRSSSACGTHHTTKRARTSMPSLTNLHLEKMLKQMFYVSRVQFFFYNSFVSSHLMLDRFVRVTLGGMAPHPRRPAGSHRSRSLKRYGTTSPTSAHKQSLSELRSQAKANSTYTTSEHR